MAPTATQRKEEQNKQTLQKYKSVHDLITSAAVQSQIKRALPHHLTPERMIRVALTAIQKTPALAECDQRSLIGAIIQAAELGLEPNSPLGHAYLIPYFNKNTGHKEAQFQVGYRGYIALARRSGEISSIAAEVVYEKDKFEIQLGTNRRLEHIPYMNGDRGKKIGAYATVTFKDSFTDFEYMAADEIAGIRRRSKSGDSGPWQTDEVEMWRKTPIRRLAKRLPLQIEDADLLIKAAVTDEYNDLGFGDFAPSVDAPPAPELISEEQRTALAQIATEAGVVERLGTIIRDAGFELLANITVDKYDAVVEAIRKAGAPVVEAEPIDTEATVSDAPPEETPEPAAEETASTAKAPSRSEKAAAKRAEYIAAIMEMERDPDKAEAIAKLLDGRAFADLTDTQIKDLYVAAKD